MELSLGTKCIRIKLVGGEIYFRWWNCIETICGKSQTSRDKSLPLLLLISWAFLPRPQQTQRTPPAIHRITPLLAFYISSLHYRTQH